MSRVRSGGAGHPSGCSCHRAPAPESASVVTVKHVAPALVIVIEVEGPTRLLLGAESLPNRQAIHEWVGSSELRAALVAAALEARSDPSRTECWLDWIGREEASSGHAQQA